MFSVFASKDRRANYELLLFIYDTFTQDECSQAIEKGEMVDKFTEYIKRHSFSELDDEEGVDILAKSKKKKQILSFVSSSDADPFPKKYYLKYEKDKSLEEKYQTYREKMIFLLVVYG